MRPHHHWIALIWSIWAILFRTSTSAEDEECTTDLQVRRNTIYEAIPGQQLRMECPVKFCNILPPPVFWYKFEGKNVRLIDNNSSHIEIQWESDVLKGKSYLIFHYITSRDSGGYQCQSEGSVSHTIYINVNGENNSTNTNKSTSETNNQSTTESKHLWMYVYSAAAIGSFVIIVIIISVICMVRCKGKSRKEKKKENQYMEMPMAERGITNATGLQYSPRGSPNPLPPRRPSGRRTPAEPTKSRDHEQFYVQKTQDRNRQRNATQAQEPGSVVYAALNHGPPARNSPRPQRQIEETEYAAIRVA